MPELDRRGMLTIAGAGLAFLGGNPTMVMAKGSGTKSGVKEYSLPPLPYDYDALEPHLDEMTLRIHHDKHHAGYVKGLNAALEGLEKARKSGDFGSIRSLSRSLAYNGAGHVLHTLYFDNLSPKPKKPTGALKDAIKAQYGSLDKLVDEFKAASAKVAASGWGLLCHEPMSGRLLILQVEKHENQIIPGVVPVLSIDVWEHAYYVKYQNKRGEYLDNIMQVVDWGVVSDRYNAAM